jgi:hypothetical protein
VICEELCGVICEELCGVICNVLCGVTCGILAGDALIDAKYDGIEVKFGETVSVKVGSGASRFE